MKAARLATCLTLAIFLATAPGFAAIPISCWDAASEFNDSVNPDAANPSGVWSYGWKTALTGKFFWPRRALTFRLLHLVGAVQAVIL